MKKAAEPSLLHDPLFWAEYNDSAIAPMPRASEVTKSARRNGQRKVTGNQVHGDDIVVGWDS